MVRVLVSSFPWERIIVTIIDKPKPASQAPSTRRIKHKKGSPVAGPPCRILIVKTRDKIPASKNRRDIKKEFCHRIIPAIGIRGKYGIIKLSVNGVEYIMYQKGCPIFGLQDQRRFLAFLVYRFWYSERLSLLNSFSVLLYLSYQSGGFVDVE